MTLRFLQQFTLRIRPAAALSGLRCTTARGKVYCSAPLTFYYAHLYQAINVPLSAHALRRHLGYPGSMQAYDLKGNVIQRRCGELAPTG